MASSVTQEQATLSLKFNTKGLQSKAATKDTVTSVSTCPDVILILRYSKTVQFCTNSCSCIFLNIFSYTSKLLAQVAFHITSFEIILTF